MQGETLKVSSQPPSCGSWRLEREIGHGAYGVVYLAFSPDGEPAAVKVCQRDAAGPERYSRELRGAKLYRAIPSHEGLVQMQALVETKWGFYAVMDLANDEFGRIEVPIESYRPKTLASVIKGEKALPLKECVNLAIFLARGLAALQLHHLLHRDIKPANVLYVCGRPVLSDPGLIVDESEAASFVGTPGYVPPEKFADAASDVYSLGLTLKAASFGRQIEDIDKGPAVEADTSEAQFSAWWRILNKATDPTPSRRYQSAKALLKELEGLRRKMKFTSIVESRIAKVALVLVLLGVAAVLVANVVAGRRAEDEIARRDAENKALKDGLSRQSEESRSLRDNFARQLDENKALRADLARQSDENKKLNFNLARQAAEIKSLKQDVAKRPVDSKALTDKEVESVKKFQAEMEAAKKNAEIAAVWNSASMRFGNYGGVVNSMIDYWSVAQLTYVGNNPNLRAAKKEFSEIANKSSEHASRFRELKKMAEEKSRKGLDITEETEAVKAIAADEDALKKCVLEIMRSIYGKDWQPSPMEKHNFGL